MKALFQLLKPRSMAGIGLVLMLFWLVRYAEPASNMEGVGLPPGIQHPLGTDFLGRDVLGISIVAARGSMVGCGAVVVSGVCLGVLLAVFSSMMVVPVLAKLTREIEHLLDMIGVLFPMAALLSVFPKLPSAAAGTVFGFLAWPAISIPIRGVIQRLNRTEYISAAKCLGIGPWRLFAQHMAPEIWQVLIPSAGALGGVGLMVLTGLEFLGLSSSVSETLGGFTYETASYARQTPWACVGPLISYGLVLCFVFLTTAVLRQKAERLIYRFFWVWLNQSLPPPKGLPMPVPMPPLCWGRPPLPPGR